MVSAQPKVVRAINLTTKVVSSFDRLVYVWETSRPVWFWEESPKSQTKLLAFSEDWLVKLIVKGEQDSLLSIEKAAVGGASTVICRVSLSQQLALSTNNITS